MSAGGYKIINKDVSFIYNHSKNSCGSQNPPMSKNFRKAETFMLLFILINVKAPERKTKVGAQRCVTQRVKNSSGVVFARSVG